MWLVMFIMYIFLSVISCILSESIVMVRDVTQIFFMKYKIITSSWEEKYKRINLTRTYFKVQFCKCFLVKYKLR